MNSIDVLGSLAGCLTTLAFLPQVLKTWRSGSAGDLSLVWLATFSAGILLWAAYGWILGSWPIVATNVLTLSLVSLLTFFKLREYARGRPGLPTVPSPRGDQASTQRVDQASTERADLAPTERVDPAPRVPADPTRTGSLAATDLASEPSPSRGPAAAAKATVVPEAEPVG